jgi:hypothetical protein
MTIPVTSMGFNQNLEQMVSQSFRSKFTTGFGLAYISGGIWPNQFITEILSLKLLVFRAPPATGYSSLPATLDERM